MGPDRFAAPARGTSSVGLRSDGLDGTDHRGVEGHEQWFRGQGGSRHHTLSPAPLTQPDGRECRCSRHRCVIRGSSRSLRPRYRCQTDGRQRPRSSTRRWMCGVDIIVCAGLGGREAHVRWLGNARVGAGGSRRGGTGTGHCGGGIGDARGIAQCSPSARRPPCSARGPCLPNEMPIHGEYRRPLIAATGTDVEVHQPVRGGMAGRSAPRHTPPRLPGQLPGCPSDRRQAVSLT